MTCFGNSILGSLAYKLFEIKTIDHKGLEQTLANQLYPHTIRISPTFYITIDFWPKESKAYSITFRSFCWQEVYYSFGAIVTIVYY